ncbi:MAG: hypothetical protein JWO69_1459 [Thermoleophilia bacterium]|jgi:hypothetical protein|nr:hypothetical protein [Thermoleophilia bacterium]
MASYLGAMEPSAARATVSNLTPSWEHDDAPVEGTLAAAVVEQAVYAEMGPQHARLISPPADFAQPTAPAPTYHAVLNHDVVDHHGAPLEYEELSARDIAREALRARIIAFAEQREHRSAFEVAFIFLSAAVAVLLAAPALVRVLLAARGIEV